MPMSVRYTTINGEIIAENRGGVRKQYVPDPLGNVIALIDDTQTVTDTFNFWPYGELQNHTGSKTTHFQFIGVLGYYKDFDQLVYVRARYLDDTTGKWISADVLYPVREANPFAYAECNPASFTDRKGLQIDRRPPWTPIYNVPGFQFPCPIPKPNWWGKIIAKNKWQQTWCEECKDACVLWCSTIADPEDNLWGKCFGRCQSVYDSCLCSGEDPRFYVMVKWP